MYWTISLLKVQQKTQIYSVFCQFLLLLLKYGCWVNHHVKWSLSEPCVLFQNEFSSFEKYLFCQPIFHLIELSVPEVLFYTVTFMYQHVFLSFCIVSFRFYFVSQFTGILLFCLFSIFDILIKGLKNQTFKKWNKQNCTLGLVFLKFDQISKLSNLKTIFRILIF